MRLYTLLIPITFSFGCAAMLPSPDTASNESSDDDTQAVATSDTSSSISTSSDTSSITAPARFGPRMVTLMNGETTLATPIGADDTSPGPTLVAPINGDPPQLGVPID